MKTYTKRYHELAKEVQDTMASRGISSQPFSWHEKIWKLLGGDEGQPWSVYLTCPSSLEDATIDQDVDALLALPSLAGAQVDGGTLTSLYPVLPNAVWDPPMPEESWVAPCEGTPGFSYHHIPRKFRRIILKEI